MAKSIINVVVDRNDVAFVAAKFRQYDFFLQKKYLFPAVRDTIKRTAPTIKNYTPRNKGGLRKSIGYIATRPKKKGDPKKYGVKVIGRLGFKRGKTPKGNRYKGNAALLVEEGVAAQMPRGKAFRIEWAKNRKYQYLKGMRARKNPYVFLFVKRRVPGQKFFRSWWKTHKNPLFRLLKKNMQRALVKTKAEAARRVRARSK